MGMLVIVTPNNLQVRLRLADEELFKFWWLDRSWLKEPNIKSPYQQAENHHIYGIPHQPVDSYVTTASTFMPLSTNGMLAAQQPPSEVVDQDHLRFIDSIKDTQNPSNCKRSFIIRKGAWSTGVGSEINGMVRVHSTATHSEMYLIFVIVVCFQIKPFMASVKLGMCFMSFKAGYYGKHCSKQTFDSQPDFSCFFEPMSSCETSCTATTCNKWGNKKLWGRKGWMKSQSYSKHGLEVVPEAFRNRGYLWYISQITGSPFSKSNRDTIL